MWVYIRCICGVFKLYMDVYMVYIRCILGAYKVDVGVYKVYIYIYIFVYIRCIWVCLRCI